ncbi:hypothetical protein ILYODFUR_006866 [Ilyodon furcidens]|uniref:Secreted protein n=1 Tax=Ilyodon furcidens TaxID=33524 RepID=A0ABV0THT7_9TELE
MAAAMNSSLVLYLCALCLPFTSWSYRALSEDIWCIPAEEKHRKLGGGKSKRQGWVWLISHVTSKAHAAREHSGGGSRGDGEEGQSCKRIRLQQAMRSSEWVMLLEQNVTSCGFFKIYICMSKPLFVSTHPA